MPDLGTITMKILIVILIPVFLLLSVSEASSLDGQQWRGLTERDQALYVLGVLDEWTNGAAFIEKARAAGQVPTDDLELIAREPLDCMKARQMTYKDLIPAANAYLAAAPDGARSDMAAVLRAAVIQVCRRPLPSQPPLPPVR